MGGGHRTNRRGPLAPHAPSPIITPLMMSSMEIRKDGCEFNTKNMFLIDMGSNTGMIGQALMTQDGTGFQRKPQCILEGGDSGSSTMHWSKIFGNP